MWTEKLTGWTCARCHAAARDRRALFGFARLCPKCYTADPPPAPVKVETVTIADFINRVRFLVPYWFAPFHLYPCHQCSHPTWQQPCHWCGFYPMGTYPPHDQADELGQKHWLDQLGQVEFIVQYIGNRFVNGASPSVNNHWMDLALAAAAPLQWPSAEELWTAFGPDATPAARDLLHPWGDHVPDAVFCELRIRELEGNIAYFEWCLAHGDRCGGTESNLAMDRRALARLRTLAPGDDNLSAGY